MKSRHVHCLTPEKLYPNHGHYSGWKTEEANLPGSDGLEYPGISQLMNSKIKIIFKLSQVENDEE